MHLNVCASSHYERSDDLNLLMTGAIKSYFVTKKKCPDVLKT
ncbi:MAG: hypothetical protein ACJAUL_003534, partial [Paraglaciecola sp.]